MKALAAPPRATVVAGAALTLGALIYAGNRPAQLLVFKVLPASFGSIVDRPGVMVHAPWLRNHGADALFAVAVGALVTLWAERNTVRARTAFGIAALFLVTLECLGLFSWADATFDPMDIAVELVALTLTFVAMRHVSGKGNRPDGA